MAGGNRASGTAARFRGLPVAAIGDLEVPVATRRRVRLLGLARLDREEAGPGLLIPHCSSVHTFGMRFALDLLFLDRSGAVLGVRQRVPPRRVVAHRRAHSVLEIPSPQGGEIPALRP